MGDIDPLGDLERRLAGDVRMMALEERAPGNLDGFWRGTGRQLEAGVQIIGGQVAKGHRLLLCQAAAAVKADGAG
jgi:hypothetical protein